MSTNAETDNPQFQPARILDIELSEPLGPIAAVDEKTGQAYHRALALVRLHTYPIGLIEIDLDKDGADPSAYAARIWELFSQEINNHLKEDGMPAVSEISVDGIAPSDKPQCQELRRKAIEAAVPISIVIATVNRTDSLKITLETLLNQDYPNFDIIIVDNAPHLGIITPYVRENYSHIPKIRCVSEEHPGLAHAHNRGVIEVQAPIAAFTDDDVIVDRYWLAEIAKGFQRSEKVGCVTGTVLPFEMETPAQELIEQFGGFNKGFSTRIFDLKENRAEGALYPYTAGTFGSGANMAFSTAALRDMGGFDRALGAGTLAMGGDDLSAFFNVVMAGYQVVYEPAACLHHMHRREYSGLSRQVYGYGVALAAYLTSIIWNHPTLLLNFMIRVPMGFVYLLSSKSPKNVKKKTYPRELTWRERKGLIYGPLAYLRSWWRTRSWKQPSQPTTSSTPEN